jgi:hypothetical protein
MEKAEIKQIVDDEIKKFLSDSLDKEVKRLLKSNNSATRGELISTIKDSFEAVYKNLWQKRDFWRNEIR